MVMARRTPEWVLISMAAELLEMHPQTLRKYERLGLVRPHRTLGSMRVYSRHELDRLRLIKSLVDEAGINLAGMRPLVAKAPRRADQRDQLVREVEALCRLLGLEDAG